MRPAFSPGCTEGFAPYRKSYTEEAFADTVLTPKTLKHRMKSMVVALTWDTTEPLKSSAYSHRRDHRKRGCFISRFNELDTRRDLKL
jgi:hypothetical protein